MAETTTARGVDPFNPASPARAYFEFLERVLPDQNTGDGSSEMVSTMPSLFVSHGAPPLLDDPRWLEELHQWGRTLPRPRGIVVVSAHWHDAPVSVASTGPQVPLTYDFGGFHPVYYTLQYRSADSTTLAQRVTDMLSSRTPVHRVAGRGLDHGAFIPLMAMYPAADVPVVQVSMPGLDPASLYELGVRLRALREEGILLIGSGFMTHSFAVFRRPDLAAHNVAFDRWAADAIVTGDVDALHDYTSKAPGVAVAHPTAEHFVPLLFTLGAAGSTADVQPPIDAMWFGNSTRSVQVGGVG